MRKVMLAILLSLFTAVATAADMEPAMEARYQHLIEELRCLVCQNQNIAESNAPLAQDLRQQVEEMLLEGRSDTEIRDYLIARYGDFVLYRPPFKPITWMLWIGPFILLALGLWLAIRVFRQQPVQNQQSVDDSALSQLLESDNKDKDD